MTLKLSILSFFFYFLISLSSFANTNSVYHQLTKINQELIQTNNYQTAFDQLSALTDDSVWKYYLYYFKSYCLFKLNQSTKALIEINKIPLTELKFTEVNFKDEFHFVNEIIDLKLAILNSLNKKSPDLEAMRWIYFEESNQAKYLFSDLIINEKINFLYQKNEWKKIIEIFDGKKMIDQKNLSLNQKCQTLFQGSKALYYTGKIDQAYQLIKLNVDKNCPEPYLNYSLYWQGLIERKLNYKTKAIQSYQKLIELYPDHQFTDDAYFYIIDLYKDLNQLDQFANYQEKFKALKQGDLKEKFLWDLAFKDYQEKKYQSALTKIQDLEKGDLVADEMKLKLFYWQGKIFEKLKDKKKAIEYYQKIIKEAPYSYYGLLANRKLNLKGTNINSNPRKQITNMNNPQLAEYVLSVKKQLTLTNSEKILELINYFRFFYPEIFKSNSEIFVELLFQSQNYHQALLLYADEKKIHPHHFLTTDQLDDLVILYPKIHSQKIHQIIKSYPNLKKYHLWGIIREESLYNQKAKSVAGAYGLMQIIPTTQTWQAKKISLKNYQPENIDHHLMIGANYFDWLLESFDQNLALAIISYNAGPGWTRKWIKQYGKIPIDEFIESIPFGETRYYVMRVLRSMMVYQLISEPYHTKLLPYFSLTIE